MAKAIFDIAGKLDLLFRIARVGNKTFTFVDADSVAYSLSGLTFQLNVKELPSSSTNVFQLTSGSGLTIGSNTIAIAVTEVQTALTEKLYYWELYETSVKKTWLCGNCYFISRDPSSESDATTVTVSLDPDTITVTISGGTSTAGTRPGYADWDASGNLMPTDSDALGSGTAGAILKGDMVKFTVAGTIVSQLWPIGTIGIANQNSPTLNTHWRLF
jgi:hypothetical protein